MDKHQKTSFQRDVDHRYNPTYDNGHEDEDEEFLKPMDQNVSVTRVSPATTLSSYDQSLESASKTKFRFKIKTMPMTSNNDNGEKNKAGVEAAPKAEYRVCDICGKEFSSGKAWGGHKRHHLKATKDSRLKARKPVFTKNVSGGMSKRGSNNGCNTIKAGDVTVSNGGKPTCCLCRREFFSMNSLFGHMRFHPDRGWKGTQPPISFYSEKNNSCCSSSIVSETNIGSEVNQMLITQEGIGVIDLLSFLSGWSKTDRRGRVITSSDPIPQAAYNLITLSRGKKASLSTDNDLQVEYPNKKKFKGNEKRDKVKRKAVLATVGSNINELENTSDEQKALSLELLKTTRRKMKKKMNLVGNSRASETEQGIGSGDHNRMNISMSRKDEFSCSSCKRCFPTFYALGGHRSSCPCMNKSSSEHVDECRLVPEYDAVEKRRTIPASEADADETEASEKHGLLPTFPCDLCGKTFPTGQALGGHKRCHWKAAKTSSNEIASTGEISQIELIKTSPEEAIESGHRSKILGIDLNEPYIKQDGEEDLFDVKEP